MTAGIPFRKVAIEVAAKYLQEQTSIERDGFIKWLGRINSEQLHYEFGLEGPILDDVNQALSKAGHNELLTSNTTITDILLLDTNVAVMSLSVKHLTGDVLKEA